MSRERKSAVMSALSVAVITALPQAWLLAAAKNISIHIRVAPGISLAVPTTYYDFGDLNVSSMVVAVSSLTVVNDSSGRTQDYLINVSTYSAGADGLPNWTIGSNPGPDIFQLCWRFNMPGESRPEPDGGVVCDVSEGGWNLFDGDAGASQSGSTNGGFADDVISLAIRHLWFQIRTPSSTSFDTYQTISITVTASDASSF
ncbi:MAG: hypothetical protein HY747_03810 [Elusimicrobia bacterium]|nr:hypothetical protein [Elusimicrobiota bacterium]